MEMTEKCRLSAVKKQTNKKEDRICSETKEMDSGEQPGDKEEDEVKQKLNKSEGMTEISGRLTEGRDWRRWWERNDLGWGRRKDERGD